MINQTGYSAFYALRDNKVQPKDRKAYIKAVCMYGNNTIGILDNNLYKDETELQMVIEYLIEDKSEVTIRLLEPRHIQKLNDEQIQKVIQKCIRYSNSVVKAVKVGEQIGTFNPQEKLEIYENIDMNDYSIADVIVNQDYPQEYFLYFNEKYKKNIVIAKLFFNRSGHDTNLNHPYRQEYFQAVLTNKDICEDLLENKKLTQQETMVIYNKYRAKFRGTDNRGWNKFYNYCKLFYNCLDTTDQDMLVDKLTNKSNVSKIPEAINDIKFDQAHLEKLEAFLMARKLRGLD